VLSSDLYIVVSAQNKGCMLISVIACSRVICKWKWSTSSFYLLIDVFTHSHIFILLGVYIPEGSEVLIVCGPRAKDFRTIKKLHNKLGEDCAIILLNARVDAVEKISSSSLAGAYKIELIQANISLDGWSMIVHRALHWKVRVFLHHPPHSK